LVDELRVIKPYTSSYEQMIHEQFVEAGIRDGYLYLKESTRRFKVAQGTEKFEQENEMLTYVLTELGEEMVRFHKL
jgi:hypothetical protein